MGRRKRGELPQMRLHKHSGQAKVTVNGHTRYLGRFGSQEAQSNYELFINGGLDPTKKKQGRVFGRRVGFSDLYPEVPRDWYPVRLMPRQIPGRHGVYIIANQLGDVEYVGRTCNLQRRFMEHKRWMHAGCAFAWVCVEQHELLFVEAWFIATLRPRENLIRDRAAVDAGDRFVSLPPARINIGRQMAVAQ